MHYDSESVHRVAIGSPLRARLPTGNRQPRFFGHSHQPRPERNRSDQANNQGNSTLGGLKNAGGYRSPMNMTDALALSPNTAFAKLIHGRD